jgi:hypothetical protein
MSVAQARRATGRRLRYTPPNPQYPYCGVLALGVDGVRARLPTHDRPGPFRIEEIRSENPAVRAERGVGIGSTAAQVRARYPRAREGGALESWSLVVPGRRGELAFSFETGDPGKPIPDNAKVISLFALANADRDIDELCA